MRGHSREKFEIDGEKLRAEIEQRGLKISQIERDCGFGQSTFNHYVNKNYITKMAREMIALRYNIQFDTYKKVEEAPQVENQVVEVVQHHSLTEEDWKQLYKVIYSATYEAMKRALSGE